MEDTNMILTEEEMWVKIQETYASNKARQAKLDGEITRLSEQAMEAMQAVQRIRVYQRHKMTLAFFFGFIAGLIALTMIR